LPGAGQLQQCAADNGLELATAAFYQAVLASSVHGQFCDQVNRISLSAGPARRALNLLIVPALFYEEKPQFGGDGRALAEIARARGHTVQLSPLLSRGSMASNAERLWRCVGQSSLASLWLVSLSKGSGEVRLVLQRHPGDPAWENICGWLNCSGLVRGTPLAQHYPLALRTFFQLAGVDAQTADELRPSHPNWQNPWRPPAHWCVINLFGVPLLRHIGQRTMRWRYTRLARLGPNDGMALLPDLLVEPGLCYPLWGADHFLQPPDAKARFARLLAYMEQATSSG
jgi:hypothetical protein